MDYLHRKKDVEIMQEIAYELMLKKFLVKSELVDEFLKENLYKSF